MRKSVTYLFLAIGLFSMNMQASTKSGNVELKYQHSLPPNHNGPRWAPGRPTSDVAIPFSVNLSDGTMEICSDYPVTNILISFHDDEGNVVQEYTNSSLGPSPYLIDLSFLDVGNYSVIISDQKNSYIGSFSVEKDI